MVTSDPDAVLLHRQWEPSEAAFTVLVPHGWQTAGGIQRIDPTAAGGPAQSIEAKLDFAVGRDAIGSVVVHWVPHTYFTSMRGMPAAGLFPEGSNYMGMMVLHTMSPGEFVTEVLIPYGHPDASDMTIVEHRELPDLAALFYRLTSRTLAPYMPIPADFGYSAGASTYEYVEGGVRYRETVLVLPLLPRPGPHRPCWSPRWSPCSSPWCSPCSCPPPPRRDPARPLPRNPPLSWTSPSRASPPMSGVATATTPPWSGP